jgi:hypothetical protein
MKKLFALSFSFAVVFSIEAGTEVIRDPTALTYRTDRSAILGSSLGNRIPRFVRAVQQAPSTTTSRVDEIEIVNYRAEESDIKLGDISDVKEIPDGQGTRVYQDRHHRSGSSSDLSYQINPLPTPGGDGNYQEPDRFRSGPRSTSIDVTSYGAKGDALTNDTAAIQRAIDAACLPTGGSGEVYFPPGYYLVSQKQKPTPATTPDLNIPVTCSGLHFFGGNNSTRRSWPQFAQAPQAVIQVLPGADPSGSPIFLLEQGGHPGATQGGQQSKFENLAINGYNEAVWVLSAVIVRFKNCALSVRETGLPDNTALKVTDTFWIYFTDGSLQTVSTVPVAMFTGENYSFETSPSAGLVTFRDVITTGGPFFYVQRFPTANAPGSFIFDNVSQEQGGASLPFLRVEGNGLCNGFGPITIIGSSISDNNPGTPFLELSGCNFWNDIALVNNSAATGGHAIQLDSGTIENCIIIGGWLASHNAVDPSGVPVSGCGNSNPVGGWDVTGPFAYGPSYQTKYTSADNLGKFNGIPFRAGKTGDLNASLALDPVMGILGGPGGTMGGWDTSFTHSGAQEESLSIARANPPSSVRVTMASGGMLKPGKSEITSITNWEGSTEQVFCAAGCSVIAGQLVTISGNSRSSLNTTVKVLSVQSSQHWSFTSRSPGNGTGGSMSTSFFYVIEASLVANACAQSWETGPSAETSASPTDSNRTAILTWAASTGSDIAGYCVWRGTTPGAEDTYVYVPGSETTFHDTGVAGTPGSPSLINNTFPKKAQYVFGLQGQGFRGTNMVGRVTLVDGKKTIAFTPDWKSVPVCVTNDETMAGVSKAVPTTSTLTILGGASDVVDYVCFGNPE